MPETDQVFSSKIKNDGIFSFKDFYKFCWDWLTEETSLEMKETAYKEKLAGDSKNIDIEWKGEVKLTDYFMFKTKVTFKILAMKEVELTQNGAKIKTNKGSVEIDIKGMLVRDYQGKFETNATRKFLRAIYEKWIIPSRVDQYETKIVKDCDEFLSEAKAYMDLEGKR